MLDAWEEARFETERVIDGGDDIVVLGGCCGRRGAGRSLLSPMAAGVYDAAMLEFSPAAEPTMPAP